MSYEFFQNKKCEYYPCHKGVREESFSCIFCYCPLYALREECGGNFIYTKKGVKDCSNCTIPHKKENYGRVVEKSKELIEIVRRKPEDE